MLRGSQRRGCDVCTTSYDQPGAALPPTGDVLWVGVRCQFQCRLCGHPSPLNHLDVDGSVSCLRCGLDQVFDVGSWIEGLDHAMRCGALAGQRDKYKQLGVSATSLELVQNGMLIAGGNMIMRSLRVSAGPGHPPCARCHTPLEIEVDGLTTKTRCPKCSAAQTCELPAKARELCSALRGVIAEELTLDKREAKVDDGGGASAIKCAHCAAPLKVTGVSTIVTCEYCGASSRIPRRTMFKLGHDQPVTQLWWLAFSRTAAAALTRPAPPRPNPRPEPARPARQQAPVASKPVPKPNGLGVLAALGLVVGVGLIGYRDDVSRWVRSVRAIRSAPTGGADTPTPAAGGSPPSVVELPSAIPPTLPWVDVAGCACGAIKLRAQVDRQGGRTSIRVQAVRAGRDPVDLDRFDLGSDPALGLGCDGDRVVIAAGSRVAAWGLDKETKVWDRSLPAPYRRASSDEPRCSPLQIAAKRITIPVKGGTTVIKLINGK